MLLKEFALNSGKVRRQAEKEQLTKLMNLATGERKSLFIMSS